jgi:hypothetical protein
MRVTLASIRNRLRAVHTVKRRDQATGTPMQARIPLCAALALAAPWADACSVSVPPMLYVNVARLEGPAVQGLKWIRGYNILDYEGPGRVLVSALKEGRRYPLAKWEDGQECSYDAQGEAVCATNDPRSGISLETHFGADWLEAADRQEELKKVYLPIIVEIDGREIRMTVRSWAVRSSRELQRERAGRISAIACRLLEEE